MIYNKRIGFFGGTFDPVHYGHLIIAEQVRELEGLDRIVFIPSGLPPHKKASEVSKAKDRYRMLEIATEYNPSFDVNPVEIQRAGKTYTIDTVIALMEKYNMKPCLLIGADVVFDLETWKDFKRVFELCDIVAVSRGGYDTNKLKEHIKYLLERYGASLNHVAVPLIDISSTGIKKRICNGQSARYMLPDKVLCHIEKNGLYKKATC